MGKKTIKNSTHSGMKIAMIGVGGGGMNTLDVLLHSGVSAAKYIAVNRDESSLRKSSIHNKLDLDAIKNDPETIAKAVWQQEIAIRKLLKGMHRIIIMAGMGGMTGSFASPEIACIARDMGISVWAIVTEPFHFEGKRRMRHAKDGIEKLMQNADVLLSISNHSLIDGSTKGTSMVDAFRTLSEAIADALKLICKGRDDPKILLDQLPYTCSIHYRSKDKGACRPAPRKDVKVCSFCGKQSGGMDIITGSKGSICRECVEVCAEAIRKR